MICITCNKDRKRIRNGLCYKCIVPKIHDERRVKMLKKYSNRERPIFDIPAKAEAIENELFSQVENRIRFCSAIDCKKTVHYNSYYFCPKHYFSREIKGDGK